jgi:glutaminyl-peptide cyclotransferase
VRSDLVRKTVLNSVLTLILLFLFPGLQGEESKGSETPAESYRVVHEYPHDPDAFTQGLLYENGSLFESTGLPGRSSLRRVDLQTGHVEQIIRVPDEFFAEGLTDWQNYLIQLTWQSHVGFVYDRSTFRKLKEFHYSGEGWGLTHDNKQLIMSDGSATLRFLDPADFHVMRTLAVADGAEPVQYLNELEYVKGEIWANVWQTDRVARISPATGKVLGWINLEGILKPSSRTEKTDVLNGIAYDATHDRLFVTGKLWPKIFEIKLQ